MATAALPKTNLYLVFAPDSPEGPALRLTELRNQHLADARSAEVAEKYKVYGRLGGPFLSPDSWPAETKMVGSMMVYEADSLEGVRARIENDIYWKNGVWDKEKVVIAPWISGTPLPPRK